MDEYFNPLDGMLEVVMEENDQEITMPLEPDNFQLPPIPTFDLHSEQYTYLAKPGSKPKAPSIAVLPSSIPLFHTKVFTRPGPAVGADSTVATNDELLYYNRVFSDLKVVEQEKLHCTICDKHLGCSYNISQRVKIHKVMNVLICKECYDFYGDGHFPLDESDNTEIFCRWCGQGGALICCSFCPKVFCNKCVRRNFNAGYLKEIEKAKEWACFCCALKPLWRLRGICWALFRYLQTTAGSEDKTVCCKKEPKEPLIRVKQASSLLIPQPTPAAPSTAAKLKSSTPPKPKKKIPPAVAPKRALIPAPPQNTMKLPPRVIVPPIRPQLPPRPQISPRLQMPPRSQMPPRPQMPTRSQMTRRPQMAPRPPQPRLQAPTPRMPAAAPSQQKNPQEIPKKIPEVRVDHSVLDQTVVRLRMPNDKSQYLRIHMAGNCQRVPSFPPNPSFTLTSLQHAFRTGSLVFDKLKNLKDKVEKKLLGGVDGEAQTILTVISKWKTLVDEIENDLTHNLKVYNAQNGMNSSDVVDLDENLTMRWKFPDTCKNSSLGIDSEIEIIDSDEGTTPAQKRKADDPEPIQTPAKKMKSQTNGEISDKTGIEESSKSSSNDVNEKNGKGDKSAEDIQTTRSRVKFSKERSSNLNSGDADHNNKEIMEEDEDSCDTVVDEEFEDKVDEELDMAVEKAHIPDNHESTNKTADVATKVSDESTNETADVATKVLDESTNKTADVAPEVLEESTNKTADVATKVLDESTNKTADVAPEVSDESTNETADVATKVLDESTNETADVATKVSDESTNETADVATKVLDESINGTADVATKVLDESINVTADVATKVLDESTNETADVAQEVLDDSISKTANVAPEVLDESTNKTADVAPKVLDESINKTPEAVDEAAVNDNVSESKGSISASDDVIDSTKEEKVNLNSDSNKKDADSDSIAKAEKDLISKDNEVESHPVIESPDTEQSVGIEINKEPNQDTPNTSTEHKDESKVRNLTNIEEKRNESLNDQPLEGSDEAAKNFNVVNATSSEDVVAKTHDSKADASDLAVTDHNASNVSKDIDSNNCNDDNMESVKTSSDCNIESLVETTKVANVDEGVSLRENVQKDVNVSPDCPVVLTDEKVDMNVEISGNESIIESVQAMIDEAADKIKKMNETDLPQTSTILEEDELVTANEDISLSGLEDNVLSDFYDKDDNKEGPLHEDVLDELDDAVAMDDCFDIAEEEENALLEESNEIPVQKTDPLPLKVINADYGEAMETD